MSSRCWIVLSAVLVAVFVIPLTQLQTESGIDMSDSNYDFRTLSAPAATGTFLKAFSAVMTSRVGPAVARHLLNANNVQVLREMGVALKGVAPLYMPMVMLHACTAPPHPLTPANMSTTT